MFIITSPNLESTIAKLQNVSEARLRRALRSAIMRTLRGARKDAGTKIKQRYTINAGRVTKTIKLRASALSGSMTSSGSRNPLPYFVVRPRSRPKKMPPGGVFVMNVRGQGGFLRHAFLQRNGQVYERVGRPRFPIKRLSGPSAPGMLGNPVVGPWIEAKMSERLGINLDHELSAVIGGFI